MKVVSFDLETRNHKVCSTPKNDTNMIISCAKFKIKELDPGFALQNVKLDYRKVYNHSFPFPLIAEYRNQ